MSQANKKQSSSKRSVFRIGNPKYILDLSGQGARLYAGRWHYKGIPLLYTAETAALSILEYLGHITPIQARIPYILVELIIHESQISNLNDIAADLPDDWFSDDGMVITRDIGKRWAAELHSPVLRVPSVHSPYEQNFLINPVHPHLSLEISKQKWYLYDRRFVRSVDDEPSE